MSAYDVLVIGGGHAGIEAAWAAARLGARTAMVTFQADAIGRMSCNPAIGGIGKGQMVREIDALGGLMGILADETGIQFRILNRRKGPAMWAPRCQSDREHYAAAARRHLEACAGLTIVEGAVEGIDATSCDGPGEARRRVTGVRLADGRALRAAAVVVTSGTFLRALMHTGERQTPGGRVGEASAGGLSGSLRSLGLRIGRLKTGTPPRLDRGTIDFGSLAEQPGDTPPTPFSFIHDRIEQPQVVCWLTETNSGVHELIRANLHRAPMYSGQIHSVGPRYCPSIEDKVVRFADKTSHGIFLEPEGRDSDRIYVNGVSTSLPEDVQAEVIRRIRGLERARVLQWGYAVEYDFVFPEQLDATLSTRVVSGLYLAGQINGTSGYEEAAGQGIVAGWNAARFASGASAVVLRRDQAYIGVMIDDLVTRGVTEPYRMFTSRAEYRLRLRSDNADERLTPLAWEHGLASEARWRRFTARRRAMVELRSLLDSLSASDHRISMALKSPGEESDIVLRSHPKLAGAACSSPAWESTLTAMRYAGYIDREERAIQAQRALEDWAIPSEFNFFSINSLRKETVDRWTQIRPRSVGQAARVSGVHPTDVSLLLVALRRAAGGSARAEM